MTLVPFVKMEGLGNDYIHVDAIAQPFPLDLAATCARVWSDRHFGIGADGLIVLLPGRTAAVRMAMWNADGSRGAMCGNGLRCVAALAFRLGHATSRSFDVETDAGVRAVEILDDSTVRAAIGEVRVWPAQTVAAAGGSWRLVRGEAGNPHAVLFVDDVATAPVAALGQALQEHPDFPGGVNVGFVQRLAPDRLRQRTFERGSGETLACGTGAAVGVAVARAAGLVRAGTVIVELRGGELRVVGNGNALAIEGPARTVFSGEVPLPEQFGGTGDRRHRSFS